MVFAHFYSFLASIVEYVGNMGTPMSSQRRQIDENSQSHHSDERLPLSSLTWIDHQRSSSYSDNLAEIRRLRQENTDLLSHMEESDRHLARALGERDEAKQRQHSAFAQLDHLNTILRDKDNALAILKKREAELQAAHTFLTSEDRCSATDVKALVEALNYEILQVATAAAQYIGEKMGEKGKDVVVDEERAHAIDRVNKLVGSGFSHRLQTIDHKEDPTPLQLAFQAALCSHCVLLLQAWDNKPSGSLSRHLTNIYQTMRFSEPQSVFARWRALTQRQLNVIAAQDPLGLLTASFTKRMLDVVVAANIHHPQLSEHLSSFLAEKVGAIEPHIYQIRNTITLDFISGDLHLSHVSSGKSFDEKSMRDAFDSESGSEVDRVVCTTEMGLTLTKKVVKKGKACENLLVLLTPQVFLESSLEELLQ